MPQPSDTATYSTDVLAHAGEILRTLKPAALGALFAVYRNDTQTQQEIAETIGSGRSTVTKYLRTQQQLGLTEKETQRYTVTRLGEFVLGLLDGMIDRLGPGLGSIDWSHDADKAELATMLEPLTGSRKIAVESYFILQSMYTRSGTTALFGTPQPVPVADIVADIDARKDEGERTDTELVRGKLRRFNETGAIHFDGQQATLTEKGQEHGRVLDKLAMFLDDKNNGDSTGCECGGDDDASASISGGSNTRVMDGTPSDDSSHHRPNSGTIAHQLQSHGFLGGQQVSVTERGAPDSQSPLTVVPAYCLRPAATDTIDEETRSQPDTRSVVPFTAMTAEELLTRAGQIVQEYGDVQLEPYWMIQIGETLYPLRSATTQTAESS